MVAHLSTARDREGFPALRYVSFHDKLISQAGLCREVPMVSHVQIAEIHADTQGSESERLIESFLLDPQIWIATDKWSYRQEGVDSPSLWLN